MSIILIIDIKKNGIDIKKILDIKKKDFLISEIRIFD